MKVLHVIPSMSAVHGGPSAAARLMERSLKAQGVETETCTTDDDGPGRRTERPLGVRIVEEGAYRWYFPKNTEFYKCSWQFARWAVHNVANYDVVHIHALFSFVSNTAAWAARRAGVPYVVRPLGTLNQYGMRMRRPGLKALSLRWLDGPIIQKAAAVHFTSRAEQQQAESLGYSLNGAVIPLALDLSEPSRTAPAAVLFPELAGKRLVLYLSRLDPIKNVESLLRAFGTVSQQHPSSHLVIAGAGESAYVAQLKALATGLGLRGRVTWSGHVEGVSKAALLRDAYVFVLPSYSENFGMAVAEALGAGAPCIVGRGVALADCIESAGAGIVVDETPAQIAGALEDVLHDGARRAEMSARARLLAEREFTMEAMGRRLLCMYNSVLSGSSPPR